jgi:hypothetical protein
MTFKHTFLAFGASAAIRLTTRALVVEQPEPTSPPVTQWSLPEPDPFSANYPFVPGYTYQPVKKIGGPGMQHTCDGPIANIRAAPDDFVTIVGSGQTYTDLTFPQQTDGMVYWSSNPR